jgi:hypothetical protein
VEWSANMPAIPHALQSFVIGDDWQIIGRLTDENGVALDPTGASSATWKLDDETGLLNSFTLTLGAGVTIGPDPTGISSVPVALITLPAVSTGTLAPGTYRDQLRLVLAGVTSTFWQGPIQALQQLT